MICQALKKVVEPKGFEVRNYGMYAADDAAQLTYVQIGILAAVLLNSGAADYVITGCGTGEGDKDSGKIRHHTEKACFPGKLPHGKHAFLSYKKLLCCTIRL